MEDKEYLQFLEERDRKLRTIEDLIISMQYEINDSNNISTKYIENNLELEELYKIFSNAQMKIFELWYFTRFNKKYGEEVN